jgi:hypothetical protein
VTIAARGVNFDERALANASELPTSNRLPSRLTTASVDRRLPFKSIGA